MDRAAVAAPAALPKLASAMNSGNYSQCLVVDLAKVA